MSYFDEPAVCPKCQIRCALHITPSQERENTCPQCGLKFTDSSEQFNGLFYGLFSESGDPGDGPVAMFSRQETLDQWLKYLEADPDKDYLPSCMFTALVDVYGRAWPAPEEDRGKMGGRDGAGKEQFLPFEPDDLPAGCRPVGFEVTAGDITEPPPELFMHLAMMVGDGVNYANVYRCQQTDRYYMFARIGDEMLVPVSINDGPTGYITAHMHGMKAAMECVDRQHDSDGTIGWLTWDEYKTAGGTINREV